MDSPSMPAMYKSYPLSHQDILKCPWQWRRPFLDAKSHTRCRKVGHNNSNFYFDPVDPTYVDQLLFVPTTSSECEEEEKSKIQKEIERLMLLQKQKRQEDSESQSQQQQEEADSTTNTWSFPLCEETARQYLARAKRQKIIEEERANAALIDSILVFPTVNTKEAEKENVITTRSSALKKAKIMKVSDQDDTMKEDNEESNKKKKLTTVWTDFFDDTLQLVSDGYEDNYLYTTSEDDDDLDLGV
jgi:hypothetical protein